MNREFVLKMAEAKRIELDAIKSLMPERSRGHVEVIGREVRAILKESVSGHQDEFYDFMKLAMECRSILCDDSHDAQKEQTQEKEKATRKVDIS